MFSTLSGWMSSPMQTLRELAFSLPAVLIGITVHEWAHARAALWAGDPTARDMGRLSLNPLDHLDLTGFLCLLLLGFGWAKPVPVNTRNFKKFKRDDLIVSLAGICTNLITAFVFTLLTFGIAALSPAAAQSSVYFTVMVSIITVNLSLAVFNIIPIYPLDGSRILENLIMRKAPKVCFFLRKYGRLIMIGCLFFGLFGAILSPAVNFLWGLFYRVGMKEYALLSGLL